MVLFIGVEMISPGSTSRKSAVAGAEKKESLQTRLHPAAAKPATKPSRTVQIDPRAGTTLLADVAQSKMANSVESAARLPDAAGPGQPGPGSSEPQVVLGSELEPDQATDDPQSGSDRGTPAVAAHTRPKVRILPEIEPLPASDAQTNAAIEQRLASIQTNLDRIGRTLDAQASRDQMRESPVDPVKQVSELLKQLQDVRERDPAPAHGASPAVREPTENLEPPDDRKLSSRAQSDSQDVLRQEIDPRDAEVRRKPVTRIYRPRYLSGSALQALVEPLLTRDLGKTGATDADPVEPSSGPSPASPGNALVVRDTPQVMQKIDQLIANLDVPPTQVVLEAVVITLLLNSDSSRGIDLREFNAVGQPFAVAPVVGFSRSSAAGGLTLTNGFGLKCGVLSGDPQAFISALEAAPQVCHNGTASARAWQMTVIDRQSAVLLLDDPFGLDASENQFALGTLLKIRPIVDRTGQILLDVRQDVEPDRTVGGRTAALTQQITLHDGQTAIVGGFFAEQTALQFYRPSGIGQLPVVGGLFRKQTAVLQRCETIVLLTPHVIAAATDAVSQIAHKQQPASRKAARDSTIQASHAESKTTPAPPTINPRARPRLKPE
jgi:type II secretory pathway component GspD/PulD (secretin)